MGFGALLALMSVFAAYASGVTTIEEVGPIGKTLNVPKSNLLSKTLPTDGLSITEDFPDKCIIDEEKDVSKEDEVYYPSTHEIYADLGTTMHLGQDLQHDYTMKTSLDALTEGKSANPKDSIQGYALKLYYYSFKKSISKPCLNKIKFREKFLKSFKALPGKIDKPEARPSWDKYSRFVDIYGTHLVRSITYGSSVVQYSYAIASQGYRKNAMRVKTCDGLGKPGAVEVKACTDITDEDRAKANQLDISTKTVVRGGSKDTRAKLLFERTKKLLEKFQQEAVTSAAPVQYSFVPIWELLRDTFFGTPDYAKAKNLEGFFKGFLNFGCEYKEIDEKVVQVFEKDPDSPDEEPSYRCKLRQEGCLTDKDCSWSLADAQCSCNGPSCIEYKKEKLGDGSVRNVPYASLEVRDVERGCKYQIWPPGCVCKKKAGFDVIWPSGNQKDEPRDDVENK